MISEIEDKIGQQYFIKSVQLLSYTVPIDLEANQYKFLGKEFLSSVMSIVML